MKPCLFVFKDGRREFHDANTEFEFWQIKDRGSDPEHRLTLAEFLGIETPPFICYTVRTFEAKRLSDNTVIWYEC